MKKINIDQKLRNILPECTIGVVSFTCTVKKTTVLDDLLIDIQKDVSSLYNLETILQIPNILASRNAYKRLGKDPSRYRLAVESLYRRIVKGHSLYRINDVVDLGNILSLKTMRPISVLDEDKIIGNVIFRIGQDEPYEGIGRGPINIQNIPIFCDEIGPFACPTSDTERTMITLDTKKVIVFIISFNGNIYLKDNVDLCIDLYQKYTDAKDFSIEII